MNKEIKTKAAAPKSNLPMLIIGAVLVGAVIGGIWFYNSSKGVSTAGNSNAAANRAAANTANKSAIPANAPPGASPPNMAGSQSAAVTIEEFADFQCGACAAVNPIMSEIKSLYGSRIKFIFRQHPLQIPAHDKAYDAAVAAEAAGMQGKFWDMQNQLFVNQQAWTASPGYKATWRGYAEKIGIDAAKWESDMAGIAAKGRVDADIARGKVLGVNTTPTVYINGISIPFTELTVPKLKPIIDGELQKAAAPKEQPAADANAASTNK